MGSNDRNWKTKKNSNIKYIQNGLGETHKSFLRSTTTSFKLTTKIKLVMR